MLTVFTWGYEGWGNSTRELLRAFDAWPPEASWARQRPMRAVTDRASDIPDPAIRERFLRQVPENARTLELSHQRWGGPAA